MQSADNNPLTVGTHDLQWQAMLDSAGAGIYAIDLDGRCTYINRAALQLLGYSREECLGYEMHALMHHHRADGTPYPAQECLIGRAGRTGRGSHIDNEIVWHKEGHYLPVEYWAEPLEIDRAIVGTIVTVNDIGKRLQHEATIREAQAAAEEANRAKSQFLASMSHELRTPLNAIIGYSEMLQEEAAELGATALMPDLQRVNSAGKHLLSLINDVLDLSKIEAGRMDLFIEEFSLSAVLEEVSSTVEPLIARNGNRFRLTTTADLGDLVSDLTKVRQVLFNLLSNAAKFTKDGLVELAAQGDPDQIHLTVCDSGIGIAPEQLRTVFEPFSQADRSTSRKYGGTGLGLAITKQFVEMLGGSIAVDSELGRGSTFEVKLPRRTANVAPSLSAIHGQDVSIEPRRLALMIDDDPVARDLTRRHLSREGFEVAWAASGDEGITLARKLRPDLITLDVMMPGMDGWAVLQTLKSDPELSAIPVVMATIVEDRNLAYVLGATDYLVKPIRRDQLADTLNRLNCRPPSYVLVVDDDKDTRDLLETLLTREGWQVRVAPDGRAALDEVAVRRPDLILLDLLMPRMDGFEFAAELRGRPEYQTIPIVVLTAKDLTAEDRLQLNGSVQLVISKSRDNYEEFVRHIREVIRVRQAGANASI